LHPSGFAKSSTSFGCGKGWNVICAGWQVTLSDPIRHVSSSSGVATLVSELLYPCYFTFYFVWFLRSASRRRDKQTDIHLIAIFRTPEPHGALRCPACLARPWTGECRELRSPNQSGPERAQRARIASQRNKSQIPLLRTCSELVRAKFHYAS